MKKTEILTQRIFSGARIFSCWKIPRTRAAALASLRQTYASTNFLRRGGGFTLIETLVAVSFLIFAIIAPLTLVSKSLSSALYARDQVTAYNLAQEGIEAVRAVRDGNLLVNAYQERDVDLFEGIQPGLPFAIDARDNEIYTVCADRPLKIENGTLYGYGNDPCSSREPGWVASKFTRVLYAEYVCPCRLDSTSDEIRLTSTVTWPVASARVRKVEIYENLYRWVEDGAAKI